MREFKKTRKILIFALLLALIFNIAAAFTVYAGSGRKTVRVGRHEPPYFIEDQAGRQSGYSYEYQRKVAAYTNWEYEYVDGTWSDLMQMLKNGEIDLMSDVSYTDERAKDMLFSAFPMGTEAYYVFIAPDNTSISADDVSTLNGKRIGVTKGSIQKEFFADWTAEHNVNAEIIEANRTDEESLSLLGKEYDAYITMDVYGSPETAVPIIKIGSSDFYFAVNKDRRDLLDELDAALNRIQDENKYYDQELHDKYLNSTELNRYFTGDEKKWLDSHGAIRVGYQDNYLAFCAKDPETGELVGALKDYLDYASSAFENAHPVFKAVPFATVQEALDALKKGEIDCMFPANLTDYDAETLGLLLTPPLMHTEMDAVVRASEQKEFLRKDEITVAVNQGNTNYDIFLADHYPTWQRKYFKDTPTGLEAIARKEADCIIISNYRYSNISKQCEKLHLTTVYTGVNMDYYFAVCEGNNQLYSILARVTGVVPASAVNSSLTYYSTEDVKTSFIDLVKDNLFIVMSTITLILLIILILLLHSIRAERRIMEEEHLVKALNKRAYIDALTSVKNKGAYFDHIQKLQERMDNAEQLEYAIGIFDCNDLKLINDKYGHDKGDIYLKTACRLICGVYERSPIFRIGGDEFAVILQNEDFKNRDKLEELFEQRRKEACAKARNKWDEVHVAHGLAVYDPQFDDSVSDTARRADRVMYENKRLEKAKNQ